MFLKERAKANGALDHLAARPRLQDVIPQEEVVRPHLEDLAHEDLVPDQ